jgi:uncharacterized protein HemX
MSFIDYSSIMLKMADLNKQIKQLLIENKISETKPLVQELLAETRLLHIWILDQLENNGHSDD